MHFATTREIWAQVRVLTISNLKARYRHTAAGFVWVVLHPALNFGVQLLVFQHFLKIQVDHYPLFLLTGLLPWLFISQSLEMCTSIFVTHGRLIRSLTVHPLVYLLSQLLENLINFMAVFVCLLVPMLVEYGELNAGVFFLPWATLNLVLAASAIAWILATFQVFMRDTRFLVSFALNFVFFLTPVFYPVSMIPEGLRWMAEYNPLHHLISPFRHALHHYEPTLLLRELTIGMIVSVLMLGLAALFWERRRNEISIHV